MEKRRDGNDAKGDRSSEMILLQTCETRYVRKRVRRSRRSLYHLKSLRVYLRLQPLLYSKHTWYNSDSLQGSEDSKCPESGKVAQIYAHRHITAIHPNITHITVIQTKRQNELRKRDRGGGEWQLRKRLLATFPMAYQKVCTNCNVNRKVAITACTIQCNTAVRRLPRIPRLFALFSSITFPFEANL